LQREMKTCFWNRRWLAAVPAGPEEAHAFVERPACRIARGKPLYVTSAQWDRIPGPGPMRSQTRCSNDSYQSRSRLVWSSCSGNTAW